jgi:SlyX protein
MDMNERLNNLETKLSFTEDLVDELNQMIYKQQQLIEFLHQEIKGLKDQLNSQALETRSLRDEIPPHY